MHEIWFVINVQMLLLNNNCFNFAFVTVSLIKYQPLVTIKFKHPRKELSVIFDSGQDFKHFANALSAFRKGEPHDLTQKLPSLSQLKNTKARPPVTSMSVKADNFDQRELKNQSLQRVIFEETKRIPKRLWELEKLTELHLTNCSLEEMPERLVNLKSLVSLNISNNRITQIPSNLLLALSNIKHLNLSHNQIEIIPLEILSLKQLITLNIAWNKVRKLPLTITTLSQLKDLNISHNELQYLPYSVMKPANPRFKLANFDFSGNRCDQEFLDRLKNWPTRPSNSLERGCKFPSLKNRSATIAIRKASNFKVMHFALPGTVYEHIQSCTNLCATCKKPYTGVSYISRVHYSFDWLSFAHKVQYCSGCVRLPVVEYNCWYCAWNKHVL